MPQVPALSVPDVGQGFAQGDLYQRSYASPDAYGAGIGGALEQAGGVASKTALSLQDVANAAAVKDASVNAISQMGDAEAAYYTKTGKDALDSLPAFRQQMQDIRKNALAGVSNPAVARMLDENLTSEYERTYLRSGVHAGEQAKQYYVQSSNAAVQLAQSKAATASSADEFNGYKAAAISQADAGSKMMGIPLDSPQAMLERQKAAGGAWQTHLMVEAKTNPGQANEELKKVPDTEMSGPLRAQLQEHITQQELNLGAQGVAQRVVSGGPTGTVTQRENYMMAQLSPLIGKTGAAALVGGMSAQESGLDPLKTNPGDGKDGSNSVGIGQWNGTRYQQLVKFAVDNGGSPGDFHTQVEFIKWELTHDKAGAAAALKAATTPEEATAAANGKYEVSADKPGEAGYNRRLGAAVRLAGSEVSAPGLTPDSGPGQLVRLENEAKTAAEAYADKAHPGDEGFKTQFVLNATQRVRQQAANVMAEHNDIVNGAVQTLSEAAVTGQYKDWDSFRNDPNNAAALEQLPLNRRNAIQAQVVRMNTVQPSAEGDARFQQILGMDRKDVMELHLEDETTLTRRQLDQVNRTKAGWIKDAEKPASYDHAYNYLKGQGMVPDDIIQDKDKLNNYRGAMALKLEAFNRENIGKPPGNDDYIRMNNEVMKEYVSKGRIWNSNYPAYNFPVPQGDADQITEAFQRLHKRPPSPAEVKQIYLQKKGETVNAE
jgi:hypothetical protein